MNTKRKPVVLIFVGCYLPGFLGGGPVRSIANLVDQLGDEFDFHIVTADRDLGASSPYQKIVVDAWSQVGKARVFYASPKYQSLRRIAELMRGIQSDVLYLNSFFNAVFTLKPLFLLRAGAVPEVPILLAPRGEFSRGALNLKRWKKEAFLKLMRATGTLNNIEWQASTEFEAADIRLAMRPHSSSIKIARNLAGSVTVASDISPVSDASVADCVTVGNDSGDLRVCFLSRVVPKKNLDFALKVLARVKAPVQFNIFGPRELPDYWADCERLIEQLPPNIRVTYGGSVENSRVHSVIADHDIFFVPTRGENFGHVFMESLSVGVPILVSDQTPWLNLKEQQLGWDISLDHPDDFVLALEEAARFDKIRRSEVRASCLAHARLKAHDIDSLNSNRNLFLDALRQSGHVAKS